MKNTIYINRVSGIHKRKTHKEENHPPLLQEFDVWLDMKVLNLDDDLPYVSFNSQEDFLYPLRNTFIKGKHGPIKGYFITFKQSAISNSFLDYQHYMKIETKALIEISPNSIGIFFPASACFILPKQIYIDGPRPVCNDLDPYVLVDYDIWLNMSTIGNIHPWVAFSKDSDVIVTPIDQNLYGMTFGPHAISDLCTEMKNPVKVDILNNNVIKNQDGSITIIVKKGEYIDIDHSTH